MLPTLPEKYQNLRKEEILKELKFNQVLQSLFINLGISQKTLDDHMRYCDSERADLLSAIVILLKENSRLKLKLEQAQKEVVEKEDEKDALRDKKDIEIAYYFENGFPDNFSN